MPRPQQRAHYCALARIQSLSPNLTTHVWEIESFSVDRKKKVRLRQFLLHMLLQSHYLQGFDQVSIRNSSMPHHFVFIE